jgi:hypothetical protein
MRRRRHQRPAASARGETWMVEGAAFLIRLAPRVNRTSRARRVTVCLPRCAGPACQRACVVCDPPSRFLSESDCTTTLCGSWGDLN